MQKNKLNLHISGIHLLNPYKTVVSHLNTPSCCQFIRTLPGQGQWITYKPRVQRFELKPRAIALDLSNVQALNMFSVCRGVVERGVQMTSKMTRHVEHSEDFTKAHVESWLSI